ncbi:MAG TPA: hypothetical protein PKH33_09875 [bacterium]|nr:hypothetical protein [bacterium]
MNKYAFIAVIAAALALINATPIYLWFADVGVIYYTNAWNEGFYLLYEISREIGLIASNRPSLYLVRIGHEAGFSGAQINMIFDTLAVIAFMLFSRAIFIRLGYDRRKSNLGAVLITFLPLLFGGLNPFVVRIFHAGLERGFVSWLTTPGSTFLPLVSSPEPQISLALMCAAIFLSLRIRSFIPMYLCMPFLYQFVSFPLAFIVVSLHLHSILERKTKFKPLLPFAPAISFCLISIAAMLFFEFILSNEHRSMLVNTRLPFVSFTGCVALGLHAILRNAIPDKLRRPAFVIALAPFVAANHQIISGWIAQPNSFEQYFGVYCASFALVLTALKTHRYGWFSAAFSMLMLLASSKVFFIQNLTFYSMLPPTPHLIEALKHDSSNVAVNQRGISMMLNMAFPKQPSTVFSKYRFSDDSFKRYLCAKEEIRKHDGLARKYADVFNTIDKEFASRNRDFVLLHCLRKNDFEKDYDPDIPPEDCPEANLKIFTVR